MQITMSSRDADFEHNKALLRKLQLAELDTLKKVISAFEKNDIQYYLGYGTLLGAIRHEGFIPWDDDVDVFLPRPDFEKFCELADQILEAPLFLNQDPMSRPVYLRNCLRLENPSFQQILPRGYEVMRANVRIDIFPIDGAPQTALARKWLFFRARLLQILILSPRMYEDGARKREDRSKIKKVIIWLNTKLKIGKHISPVKLVQKFDKLRRRYSYEDSEWVVAWVWNYRDRIFCKKEWFGTGRRAMFEGVEMCVPSNSEAVLQQYYGDYMTLPPEDQRVLRHIVGFVENNGQK